MGKKKISQLGVRVAGSYNILQFNSNHAERRREKQKLWISCGYEGKKCVYLSMAREIMGGGV